MIFLGFGKYARADKIYALEPLRGRRARGGPADAGLGRGRLRSHRRVAHRADDPRRDGRRRPRRTSQLVDDALALARRLARRRRAGPARPRRPPAPRAPAARGHDAPGRLEALLSDDPRLPDEAPPGSRARASASASRASRSTSRRCASRRPSAGSGSARRRRTSAAASSQVALPFQIYELTGSTLAVAALSFVELVPLVTLTLLGGALADAVDRRRLLLWTQVGMAVDRRRARRQRRGAEPQVWACFVLAFFSASFFCLGVGGMRSITPRLVAPGAARRPRSCSRASRARSLRSAVRRSAASSSARSGSPRRTRSTSATFVAGIASISRCRRSRPSPTPTGRACVRSPTASATCVRQPVVLGFMLVDVNAMVFGMPMALFPAIATHKYGDPRARRLPVRRAVRRRARRRRSPPAGSRTCAGRGSRSRSRPRLWGVAIAAFGFADTLWARARAARRARARPTTSAPSSARRSC